MATSAIVTRTVDAENEFTDPIYLRATRQSGSYRGVVRIVGTSFVGTIELQARLSGESTFVPFKEYTANVLENIELFAPMELRIGVATGDFTSGSAVVAIIPA
jgi:hypothetical protein